MNGIFYQKEELPARASAMIGNFNLTPFASHPKKQNNIFFGPKFTIEDTYGSLSRKTKDYSYKNNKCSGYIEHSVPGLEEKVFIPIQLKIAITVVSLASPMLVISKETTAVRQIDALFRACLGCNEFLLIHEDGKPNALIGKMDMRWITQTVTPEDSGNIISSKGLLVQEKSLPPPPNMTCIGKVGRHDITKTPGKVVFSDLVYALDAYSSSRDVASHFGRNSRIHPG